MTLKSLVLVSRTFHDLFKQFLYSSCAITLSNYEPFELKLKSLPSGIKYTQHFDVRILEITKFKYHVAFNSGYASYLAKVIMNMPNLQSFQYAALSCTLKLLRNLSNNTDLPTRILKFKRIVTNQFYYCGTMYYLKL
jgi:hypothetical protein